MLSSRQERSLSARGVLIVPSSCPARYMAQHLHNSRGARRSRRIMVHVFYSPCNLPGKGSELNIRRWCLEAPSHVSGKFNYVESFYGWAISELSENDGQAAD